MSAERLAETEEYPSKILIPVATYVDRQKISHFLYALSAIRNPLIVLLHVVEVPSRTGPLEPYAYYEQIAEAESRLRNVAEWLSKQGYSANLKVVVARSVSEAIVDEANSGDYAFVFMLKRRVGKGIQRLFQKSVSEAVIRRSKAPVVTSLMEEMA